MPGDGQYFPLKDPVFRERSLRQFHTACVVSVRRYNRLNSQARPELPLPTEPLLTNTTQCDADASTSCTTEVEDPMVVDGELATPSSAPGLAAVFDARSSVKRPLPADIDAESNDDGRRVRVREDMEAIISSLLQCAARRPTRAVHPPRYSYVMPRCATGVPRSNAGHRRILSACCRAPASQSARDTYIQTLQLQGGIKTSELKSLVPLGYVASDSGVAMSDYVFYTLPLRLCPSRSQHGDLFPFGDSYYYVSIDSADWGFWFFAQDFLQIPGGKDGSNVEDFCPWPDTEKDPSQQHKDRAVIPLGALEHLADSVPHGYVDGTQLRLNRWSDLDLPFCAPSWDWRKNDHDNNTTYLEFPRVLATATTEDLAHQLTDGNLGLAIPGVRHPWTDVGADDRLTFFDILTNGTPKVETPSQLTIRLLVPDLRAEYPVDGRTRSHLYYGLGSPCGVLFDDKIYVPTFSPPLEVLRHPQENCYDQWRLELKSMTLLKPNKPDPPRDSLAESDWTPITIDTSWPNSAHGIQVVLDTGSVCSVLPDYIIREISESWFHTKPTNNGRLLHQIDFSNHDILFNFCDANGQDFTLRCAAQDFLTSPWTHEVDEPLEPELGEADCPPADLQADLDLDDGVSNADDFLDALIKEFYSTANPSDATANDFASDTSNHLVYSAMPPRPTVRRTYHLTQLVGPDSLPNMPRNQYILGMNFFWVAMVKLSTEMPGGPLKAEEPRGLGPTVQLAPQRVLLDSKVLGGPRDLKIPFDLPPRLQALFREQPELAG